jgi:hypothetical protein
VFYSDTIYLASDGHVVIQIEEPGNPFMPLLVHKEDNFCLTNLGFQDYYTNIDSPGEYTLYVVDTEAKNPPSLFYVFKGDFSSLEKTTIRANTNSGLEYQITVPDHFQNYEWSSGDTDHFINTETPGTYSVSAKNHCNETFEKSFILDESHFYNDLFYVGKDAGINVNYVDIEPDVTFSGHPLYNSVELDFDNNGTSDMILFIDYDNLMGLGHSYFTAEPLNGTEILFKNNPELVDTLNNGDIINDLCSFSDSTVLSFLSEWYSYPVGCLGGYWGNSMNYLGFKMNAKESPVYGWIRILFNKSWQSAEFIVYDYAYTTPSLRINTASKNSLFDIFPNPFTTNINLNTQLQDYSIMMLDVFGNRVFNQDKINGSSNVELQSLPSGVYFLTIESEGIRQTQKVIKQ